MEKPENEWNGTVSMDRSEEAMENQKYQTTLTQVYTRWPSSANNVGQEGGEKQRWNEPTDPERNPSNIPFSCLLRGNLLKTWKVNTSNYLRTKVYTQCYREEAKCGRKSHSTGLFIFFYLKSWKLNLSLFARGWEESEAEWTDGWLNQSRIDNKARYRHRFSICKTARSHCGRRVKEDDDDDGGEETVELC